MAKLVLFGIFLFSAANAQNIDVRGVNADDDKGTTIEIRKGSKAVDNKVLWEVVDGNGDIAGEHSPLSKDARDEWKKACDSWKKEIREDNKENKVLNITCGQPTCVSENEGTICKSKGNYKVKTRVN